MAESDGRLDLPAQTWATAIDAISAHRQHSASPARYISIHVPKMGNPPSVIETLPKNAKLSGFSSEKML
jgi:hypothetical protein